MLAGGGGCGPFVVRYNGSAWDPLPNCTSSSINFVQAVSGTSPTDVFRGERYGDAMEGGTTILHYNGQSWTTSYTSSCATTMCGDLVYGLWSRTPTNAFAVGANGVILHYDGSSWSAQTSGTTAPLYGVWGDQATGAVFAVGTAGTILRFNGTAWSAQSSGTTQPLFAIWGSSPVNVFAVGANGTILHYDGTSWSVMTSGSTKELHGIWGSGNSIFAVGQAGTILHYDGTSWTTQTFRVPISLAGVWGASPSDVFAVGGSP